MKEKKKKLGLNQALSILWKFMTTKERFEFVAIAFLSFFPALISIYMAMIPSIFIAKFTGEDFLIFGFLNLSTLSDVTFIFVVFAILIAMYSISMIIYRAVDVFARKMMCIANTKVEELLLLERKNLDFGMTNGEANYIAKNAVDNIYHIIQPLCWNFLRGCFFMIFVMTQIFLLDIYIALIEIAMVGVVGLTIYLRTKIQKNIVKDIENSNAKIGNHFLMTLINLPMITIFKSKKKEMEELAILNTTFKKHNMKLANLTFVYWVVLCAIKYLSIAGILFFYYVMAEPASLATNLVLLFNLTIKIYTSVEDWGFQISDIQSASIKLCNLKLLFPENRDVKKQLSSINENVKNSRIWSIKVDNYYVHLGSFEKTYNTSFQSGKVYVLSGQSGNGKTTLINAICGLREIESGNLVINRKEIVPSLYEYRDKICYLFQESILFDRPIEDNLAYPEDYINEKVNLLIDEFNIKKLLLRDKTTSSFAKSLSGGEKKRVEIIRTISKDKDIYFFDEPTNELDPANVEKVLKEIKQLALDNKIVVVISHDKRLLNIADKIVQL